MDFFHNFVIFLVLRAPLSRIISTQKDLIMKFIEPNLNNQINQNKLYQIKFTMLIYPKNMSKHNPPNQIHRNNSTK